MYIKKTFKIYFTLKECNNRIIYYKMLTFIWYIKSIWYLDRERVILIVQCDLQSIFQNSNY